MIVRSGRYAVFCSSGDGINRYQAIVALFTKTFFVVGFVVAALSLNAQVTTRDSAGVNIVTNHGVFDDLPRWTLSDTPEIVIGAIGSGPEAEFVRPASVVMVNDSLVQVADWVEENVRYFRLDGSHFLTYGRSGDGPGEFRGLAGVVHHDGDTLVAFDGALRRLTYFGLDGNTYRTVRLQQPEAEFGRPQLVAANGSGGFYFEFGLGWIEQTSEVMRTPVNLYVLTPEGVPGRAFASVPGLEWVRIERGAGQFTTGARPFSRRAMLMGAGRFFYAGETGVYAVSVYDNGRLVRRIERPVSNRMVTSRDIRTLRAEAEARGLSRQETERRFPAELFPTTMPSVARLTVDRLGFLWVERFSPSSTDEHLWEVFDTTGVLVATCRMPARVIASDIGSDYVLAVEKGSFDVLKVSRYALRRGGQ